MLYIAPVEKTRLIAQSEQSKNLRRCDYCGKPKHTREICRKLYGKPTRGSERKNGGPTKTQENLVEKRETLDTQTVKAFSNEEI